MHLESDSAEPLYIQLAYIIREDIQNGKYNAEQRIPTEKELSEIYSVSRITIRSALEILVKEGLLMRRRGKGTFIASKKLYKSMSGIYSFTDICNINGMKPGAKTIKCVIEDAEPEDITELELTPEDKIIAVERIRYADDVPVSIEISRYPSSTYQFLLDEDLNNVSLFAVLNNKHNIRFSHATKVIEVKRASYQMATYLGVPRDYPLLYISSLTYDMANMPSHRTQQYINSDRFKLII